MNDIKIATSRKVIRIGSSYGVILPAEIAKSFRERGLFDIYLSQDSLILKSIKKVQQ